MINVLLNGYKPRDAKHENKKLLLFSASAFNLSTNNNIHRLSLFSFIQTHLANKSEENLQKTIETDFANWEKSTIGKKGYYSLTSNGISELDRLKKPQLIIAPNSVFEFSIENNNKTLSIIVDPTNKQFNTKYTFLEDSKQKSANIINENYTRFDKKGNLPRRIFNWVLANDKYSWTIKV